MAEERQESIADRTLWGAQQIMERALGYVDGLEKVMVTRGIQTLYPRIEQRIRRASDDDLIVELKYLRDLLDQVLDEPKTEAPKQRKQKQKRTQANKRSARKPAQLP